MRPSCLARFALAVVLSGLIGCRHADEPLAVTPTAPPADTHVSARTGMSIGEAGGPSGDGAGPLARPLAALTGPVALTQFEKKITLFSTWSSGGGFAVGSGGKPGGGHSEIDWRHVDLKGAQVGPVKVVVANIPGKIVQMEAAQVVDRSAVVWCSQNEKGARFFAVQWVDERGEPDGKRVDLGMEDHAPCHFSLIPEQRGVSIVHMTAKKEPCVTDNNDKGPQPVRTTDGSGGAAGAAELCPSFILQRSTPPANMTILTDFRIENHRSPADVQHHLDDSDLQFSAVATDRSVLLLANVQSSAFRPDVESFLLPGSGEPGLDTVLPGARYSGLFWTGDAALIVGHSLGRGKGKKEAQGLHATLWLASKLGGDTGARDEFSTAPWPRVTRTALRCDGQKMQVEVTGERGLKAVLDPAAEGASFSLAEALSLLNDGVVSYGAALWTGEVLLTWGPGAALIPHRCSEGMISL